jgi:hypothetical protein
MACCKIGYPRVEAVMSALEKEIIEKFRQLAPESRARMLSTLQEELTLPHISLKAWLAEAEQVRISLSPDASGRVPSASELVNEAREERDADILRSIGFGDSAGNGTN